MEQIIDEIAHEISKDDNEHMVEGDIDFNEVAKVIVPPLYKEAKDNLKPTESKEKWWE